MVTSDQAEAESRTKRQGCFVALIASGAWGLLLWVLGDGDKAALAGFATTVVVVTALARWDLREQLFFWAYLLVVSAGHAVLIAGVQISLPTPTKLFAPIVVIDFVLVLAGLFALEWLMKFSRRAQQQ